MAARRKRVEARGGAPRPQGDGDVPDEAAFYGPKIDMKLLDALGRKWQLSTVQFDFNLPRSFGLEYVAEDGKRHQPMMVHRALYGSVERFFGTLIEHYAGAFPVWLAPVQTVVLPITDRQVEYAQKVQARLEARRAALASRRSQGESESEDPRCADAKGAVHAGGRRSRGRSRHRLRASSQARRLWARNRWKQFVEKTCAGWSHRNPSTGVAARIAS